MITGNLAEIRSPIRTITARILFYQDGATWDDIASNDRLQSIEIDRVGENKFFGFGISQKATVKVADREQGFTDLKGVYFNAFFNDYKSLPTFYADKVSRDEKTDVVTITAYDAINEASAHTVAELGLTSYTIGEFAAACAECLGITAQIPALAMFTADYVEGANFDGTETIREALNAIAEATQTIYYVNYENKLVFTQLDKEAEPQFTIDKSLYFTLDNKNAVTLNEIALVTELGNNISDKLDIEGVAQNIYNNPFFERDEIDVAGTLSRLVEEYGGISINQFNCVWRGNYLLEPCDKISIVTKDDINIITTYLINDTITYNGGFKQVSKWEYSENEKPFTNPVTLGETLKQTYAKVDKANKQIDLVASESNANSAAIAALQINTDSINASVSTIEKQVNEANNTVAELTKKVSATVTEEQVNLAIESKLNDGVNSVETATGFTFNADGLTVSKSDSNISTTITEDGMRVAVSGDDVLTANNQGVKAIDLHAETYLLIGKNSRFEDYDNKRRTGCFWIGG